MKKIKIIFFIYQLGAGGAARTMLNILNKIDRGKFTPILVTLNYEGSYEEYLASDIKFIKLNTKRLRSAIFPLAKVIREEKADIVFSTIPNYNTIAILANVFSLTPAKNVVREAAFLGGNFFANVKLLAYGMLYKLSSQVIALSKGVKENIVKRYKVNPKKIKVIYNPVDLLSIQQNAEIGDVPEEHAPIFRDDAKVIVTAGRLVSDKDHQTLLKAFAQLKNKMNARLIILGEGELEKDLKKLASDLSIKDDVFFLGFQQNPYVYFKHADLFALSSLKEGFGHVLAEALATGTLIVSTNCKPGAEEVLNHGEYGKLCAVGDAEELAESMFEMLSLTNDEAERLKTNGIKRAKEFDAETIVKQYETTFIDVVGQRKATLTGDDGE